MIPSCQISQLWIIKQPKRSIYLNKISTGINPSIFWEEPDKIIKHYPRHSCIFTDGMKDSHNEMCSTL